MVALPHFRAWQFHRARTNPGGRPRVSWLDGNGAGPRIEAYERYAESEEGDRRWHEGGALVHSTEIAIQFNSLETELAVQVVRQAFVTSAFYYWERSARAWTSDAAPNFPALKTAIEAQGIALERAFRHSTGSFTSLSTRTRSGPRRSSGKVRTCFISSACRQAAAGNRALCSQPQM
jgi:hypothetical protein